MVILEYIMQTISFVDKINIYSKYSLSVDRSFSNILTIIRLSTLTKSLHILIPSILILLVFRNNIPI